VFHLRPDGLYEIRTSKGVALGLTATEAILAAFKMGLL